jgi:endonuclease/exonuclease/phosphatase (EEP) superfamily protein YafD
MKSLETSVSRDTTHKTSAEMNPAVVWPRRSWFGRYGRTICFYGLIIAILALASPWLSAVSLLFDFVSHLTLHYLLAAFAFLIGFLLPRFHLTVAVAIIAAGMALVAWWPQHISRQPVEIAKVNAGERALRVMTFNTWLSNGDWKAVVDEIRLHDPDVVTLVEFGKEKQKAFDALRSTYPYSVHCIEKHYCHMAILSKHELFDFKTRNIWRGPAYIRARLGPAFGNTHVFGIHSTRPPRVRSQIKQMRAMMKLLNQLPGQKIVMGDFNSTPYARLLRQFAKNTGLERVTFLPTWPARWGPYPQLAIDHVMISEGVRPISRPRIGEPAGSDHFPAIIDLAVTTKP